MRRYLSIGIVAVWLVMMGVLLYRTWPASSAHPTAP